MKLSGLKAHVHIGALDISKVISNAGSTDANKWYRILEKADDGSLPFEVGFPFRSPTDPTDQITLVSGDSIVPLDNDRFCKTTASISTEQGSIDAGDDCDPGAEILDGIIKSSGSLAGLTQYNDVTGDFDDVTNKIINRFYTILEDDAEGTYRLTPKSDEPIFILINLNSDAKVGQTEIWAYFPINIVSMGNSFDNSSVQNKDLSWTKAPGEPCFYKRKKIA